MDKTLKHLSREAQELHHSIVEDFDLGDAELKILRVALEAFDRSQAAREQIEAEGMTVPDRFGQAKPHPLLNVERDSRSAFYTGMKHLGLEYDPDEPRRPGRPPESGRR